MKILERQKQLKKMQKSLIEDAEKYTKTKQDNAENNVRRFDDANAPNTNCANVETTSSGTQTCNEAHSAVAEKSTEVHSEKSTPNESLTIMPASPTVTPPRNQKALTDKLRSWETIYTSIR